MHARNAVLYLVCSSLFACTEGQPASSAGDVWRDTSAHVRIEAGSWEYGSTRFERDAADLTAEQVAALQGLVVLDGVGDECAEDGRGAHITVVDDDGSSTLFAQQGYGCGEADQPPQLSEASVDGVLRTLPCLYAAETQDYLDAGARSSRPERLIAANDGCQHGVSDGPAQVTLDVTAPGVPYTIEALDCVRQQVTIELYDESRETLLAEGEPQAGPDCARLVYTFAEAGHYVIRTVDPDDALPGQGWAFLRVTHE